MARVEVAGDQLTVQIQGLDRLWTFKSRLEIPLAHVTGAEADPEVVRGWKGWRGPGAHIPGGDRGRHPACPRHRRRLIAAYCMRVSARASSETAQRHTGRHGVPGHDRALRRPHRGAG